MAEPSLTDLEKTVRHTEFLVTASPLAYADHKHVLLVMENVAGIHAALQ